MIVERGESSVVVSLNEILRLEERRSEEEADARRAREATERLAAAELEARVRAAEAERRRDAESRARAEAIADREREACFDAAKEAELVRARHEAEATARMKELQATQAHEQRLIVLREAERRTGLQRIAYGVFALLAATWTMGGWYSLRAAHRMDEERASYWRERSEQTRAYGQLEQAFNEERDAVAALQKKLEGLPRNDAPAAALRPAAPSSARNPSAAQAAVPLSRAPSTAPLSRCKEGDPLCSDIR